MDPRLPQLRSRMVAVARQLQRTGLVAAGEGNLSVRLAGDRLLTTPAGLRKGELTEGDLVVVDLTGRRVPEDTVAPPHRVPSSEIRLHLEVVRRRPEAEAVLHAHPETAVAASIAGVGLHVPLTPETVVVLDEVPTAPYAMPGTAELPATLAGLIERADAVVLGRHGAVSWGYDLEDALNRMEVLEKHARILAAARAMGGARPLPAGDVERLRRYRAEVYLPVVRAAALRRSGSWRGDAG